MPDWIVGVIFLVVSFRRVSMVTIQSIALEIDETSGGFAFDLTLTSDGFPMTEWREFYNNGTSGIATNGSTIQENTRQWTNTNNYLNTFRIYDSSCRRFQVTLEDRVSTLVRNLSTLSCEKSSGSDLISTSKPDSHNGRSGTIEMQMSHVYMAAGVGGGVVLIIICITATVCIRNKRKRSGDGHRRKDSDSSVSGPRSTHPYAEIDARTYEALDSNRRETHAYIVPGIHRERENSYLEPVVSNRHLPSTSEFSSVSSEFENPVYNMSNPSVATTARSSRFLNIFTKKPKPKAQTPGHVNELYMENTTQGSAHQEMETPFATPGSLSTVNEEADLATRMDAQIPLFNISEATPKGNAYENVMEQRSFKKHHKVSNTLSAPANYVNVSPIQRRAKLTM